MAKSIWADLLSGFSALVLIMAGFITGVLGENLRSQVIVVGILFLIGGLFRGAALPSHPWTRGLLVNLGSSVPLCIMAATGVAFTSKPHLIAFLVTSLVGAMAGAHAGRFWRLSHRGAGLALAGSWVAVVVLVAQLVVPTMLERLSTSHVKYLAPQFSFRRVDGSSVTPESLRGKVVVLAFWATWCAPCRRELPRLDRSYERYSNDPGVVFLAVDDEREDFAASVVKTKAFLARQKISLPLVISDTSAINTLGVNSLPTLLVIDQQGYVRLIHRGYDDAERLEDIVSSEIATLR